jgi:hypothetical protein
LYVCPCLNDHPAWIEAMRTILVEEGQGWLPEPDSSRRARASALAAEPIAPAGDS